jgi:16S rRNA (uracil1498-N3)-methyltransferase
MYKAEIVSVKMRVNRFYLDSSLESPSTIEGSEFHHLVHVMRVERGDEIELVNGRGKLARARIDTIHKDSASFFILKSQTYQKPVHSIRIALALIRLERLEWAIEKATELGAEGFDLFRADESEKKELNAHQLERLRSIVISAMKQCGRFYLPDIKVFPSLDPITQSNTTILFGDTHPAALRPLQAAIQFPVIFATGPERGFSAREHALLKQKGCGVSLSDNILRAETAPLAALSILRSR